MREFNRLTPAQQQAFLEAVNRYIITPLLTGQQPSSNMFHKMGGYNLYEFRYDLSGRFRATCQMFTNAAGETQIEWRRIGGHEVYQNPQYTTTEEAQDMNIKISEEAYEDLKKAAQLRGMTPEAFIEWLISQQPIGYATNAEDFYRGLGLSDERIAAIQGDKEPSKH